jgi:hypothetical protein
MTFNGAEFEVSNLVLPGYWIFLSDKKLLGMVGQERREFYAKFGLTIETPQGATKILVDRAEYTRLRGELQA